MINIFVTYYREDRGFCKETFKEVFRIVDGEKIYPEHAKYFNRMTDYTDDWYTVYPSQGYWENCDNVKEDIKFSICDKKGETIYFENSEDYIWVDRYLGETINKFINDNKLLQYEQWKEILCNNEEFKEYSGYRDTWLYCESKTIQEPELITKFEYLGIKYQISKEIEIHKLCNVKYTTYWLNGGNYGYAFGYEILS